MPLYRELQVPKYTYYACVSSNNPHVFHIVLFFWRSIILMFGLQWKKDWGEKKVRMRLKSWWRQHLDKGLGFQCHLFRDSKNLGDSFSGALRLLIWCFFAITFTTPEACISFLTPSPETPCLSGLGAPPFGLLCYLWYILPDRIPHQREAFSQSDSAPSMGLKTQVVYWAVTHSFSPYPMSLVVLVFC